ncbi:MAG: MFS transporter [Corynebacterium sp.]|nr:MFS transporter [Corynebacterium sp.]
MRLIFSSSLPRKQFPTNGVPETIPQKRRKVYLTLFSINAAPTEIGAILGKFLLSSNALDALAGNAISLILQIVIINQLGFTGWQLGILNAAPILLYLATSITIGRAIDTLPAERFLFASLLAKIIVIGRLTALYLTIGLTFITVLLLSIAQAFLGICISNSQFVVATQLQRANPQSKLAARIESADQAARIIAPGIVTLVVAHSLYSVGFLGGIAVALAANLLIVPLLRQPQEKHAEKRAQSGFFDGFRILWADRRAWFAVLLVALGNLGLALGDSAGTLLLLRGLRMSEQDFSLLNLVSAIFGLATSIVAVKLVQKSASPPWPCGRPLGKVWRWSSSWFLLLPAGIHSCWPPASRSCGP